MLHADFAVDSMWISPLYIEGVKSASFPQHNEHAWISYRSAVLDMLRGNLTDFMVNPHKKETHIHHVVFLGGCIYFTLSDDVLHELNGIE